MSNSLRNQLTTVEEKNALKRLHSEMNAIDKKTQSIESRIEDIDDAIDERVDDYIEENYEEFFTTRKSTAQKLRRFLSKYGRIRVESEDDSHYKYLLAKKKYTEELINQFNRTFMTDIARSYIGGRRVEEKKVA